MDWGAFQAYKAGNIRRFNQFIDALSDKMSDEAKRKDCSVISAWSKYKRSLFIDEKVLYRQAIDVVECSEK